MSTDHAHSKPIGNRTSPWILTGVAGFIGMHTTLRLERGETVIGVDNLNDYYDVALKEMDVECYEQ